MTLIVIVVSAISGLITVRTEQRHLLNAMVTGADQLSKSITSATWHAMLDDHREAAYEVMQTIGREQGIDRIRMFNRTRPIWCFRRRRRERMPARARTRVSSKTRPVPKGDARIRILSGAWMAGATWPWSRPIPTNRLAARPPAMRIPPR